MVRPDKVILRRLVKMGIQGYQPPASPVDDQKARNQLETNEARAYTTYRAREAACVRLGRRARAWNWALVAFSTATTVAAIGMLTDPMMYGTNGSTLMVCVSVLTLVVSLATTNMDYSGRSRDMFLNYRKIQRLSVEMEELRSCQIVTLDSVRSLMNRYQAVLDESENHTTGDYYRSLSTKYPAGHPLHRGKCISASHVPALLIDFAITSFPYLFLLLPLVLLMPLISSLIP